MGKTPENTKVKHFESKLKSSTSPPITPYAVA
jgi:hypothetical protein